MTQGECLLVGLREPYPSHNSAGVMQEFDPSTRHSQ